MKKLLSILIIIILSAISALASDWVGFDGLLFDKDSISKYENYPYNNQEVYSIWIKYDFNNYIQNQNFTSKLREIYPTIDSAKVQYLLNCDKKTIAIKHSVQYDSDLNSLGSDYTDDLSLHWESIIPDSQGDMWYMVVCKAYKQSLTKQ